MKALILCAALAFAAPAPLTMAPEQKITHALNRLTFGPRPTDAKQVAELGLQNWIDQQLHPESIPENPELESRLAPLDTLRMSTEEMLRHYPSRQMIKGMNAGALPLPQDPFERAAVQIAMQRAKKTDPAAADDPSPAQPVDFPQRPADRVAYLEKLPPDQLAATLAAIPQGQRLRLATLATPELRRKIEILSAPMQVISRDLVQGKLLRAVYSNRQLEEVLVDFWYNHFNVFLDKGADRDLVTAYERDVIHPHVLGHFKDLLVATAQSPAMLFYLDNWQSSGPNLRPNANPNAKRAAGLNENYGRELLELHTLGVDNGYTQQDVTEVARCFTGWTMRQPRQGGGFFFNPRTHDSGEKHVLGVTIKPSGINEGLQVLDILAHHPATAHFISTKLATRFAADDPPPALVKKMEATFRSTDGDIRAVLRTMLDAPEFWEPARLNAKLKSPLEFVVSTLRASGDELPNLAALNKTMNELGEPLYRKQEPTGYSNRGADWMNSASLLARMNFATSLHHPDLGSPDFQRK